MENRTLIRLGLLHGRCFGCEQKFGDNLHAVNYQQVLSSKSRGTKSDANLRPLCKTCDEQKEKVGKTINVPKYLMNRIDGLIRENDRQFPTRSDVILAAVREFLSQQNSKQGQTREPNDIHLEMYLEDPKEYKVIAKEIRLLRKKVDGAADDILAKMDGLSKPAIRKFIDISQSLGSNLEYENLGINEGE